MTDNAVHASPAAMTATSAFLRNARREDLASFRLAPPLGSTPIPFRAWHAMTRTSPIGAALSLAAVALAAPLPAQRPSDLGGVAKVYFSSATSTDWDGLDALPGFRWAPLPPTSLPNCLANGDCFARQGAAVVGGRQLQVLATGARTIVGTLLLRSQGGPLGAPAILASLVTAGITTAAARCPADPARAATTWYRITGAGLVPGFVAIQPATAGRPNEGLTFIRGEQLPTLPPAQLTMYSDQCAAGAERKAVATRTPVESLADAIVALLSPTSGPALYDWGALRGLPVAFTWDGEVPKQVDLTSLGDPNPMSLNGTVSWGGRTFSLLASGTASQVKTIHLDEQGMHPKGEHVLGLVYARGIQVKKARCGPVYTESTNDWYALTGAATHAATIRQSIRYDGNRVQDAYELRLDASLPPRDPRDRNPGVGGC